MKPVIHVFENQDKMAEFIIHKLILKTVDSKISAQQIHLALSGGNTPKTLFRKLSLQTYKDKVNWSSVHLFWVDERCVAPHDQQSNYGMVYDNLLRYISIPDTNVHRIKGEEEPEAACQDYAAEIRKVVPYADNFPRFDWILLGVGDDGHTASLFPGSKTLKEIEKVCVVAEHPVTGQKRVSLTLPVLNNSKIVTFMVSGSSKKEVVRRLVGKQGSYMQFPAALVQPYKGILEWCLDKEVEIEISSSW
jgi:6-phosphogluconolactonase